MKIFNKKLYHTHQGRANNHHLKQEQLIQYINTYHTSSIQYHYMVYSLEEQNNLITNLLWRINTSMPIVKINKFYKKNNTYINTQIYPCQYVAFSQNIINNVQIIKNIQIGQAIYMVKQCLLGIYTLMMKFNQQLKLSNTYYQINTKGKVKIWSTQQQFMSQSKKTNTFPHRLLPSRQRIYQITQYVLNYVQYLIKECDISQYKWLKQKILQNNHNIYSQIHNKIKYICKKQSISISNQITIINYIHIKNINTNKIIKNTPKYPFQQNHPKNKKKYSSCNPNQKKNNSKNKLYKCQSFWNLSSTDTLSTRYKIPNKSISKYQYLSLPKQTISNPNYFKKPIKKQQQFNILSHKNIHQNNKYIQKFNNNHYFHQINLAIQTNNLFKSQNIIHVNKQPQYQKSIQYQYTHNPSSHHQPIPCYSIPYQQQFKIKIHKATKSSSTKTLQNNKYQSSSKVTITSDTIIIDQYKLGNKSMTTTWRSGGTSGSHGQSHSFGQKDQGLDCVDKKKINYFGEIGEICKNNMDSVILQTPIGSQRNEDDSERGYDFGGVIPLVNGVDGQRGKYKHKQQHKKKQIQILQISGKDEQINDNKYNEYQNSKKKIHKNQQIDIKILQRMSFVKKIITLDENELKKSIQYNDEKYEKYEKNVKNKNYYNLQKLNKYGKDIYTSYIPNQ